MVDRGFPDTRIRGASFCTEGIAIGCYVQRRGCPMIPVDRMLVAGRPSRLWGKEGKMDNRQYMRASSAHASEGASWINIALGLWVIISPFVIQFARLPAAMWNNVIVGIVIAVLAIIRTSAPRHTAWSWPNVVLGIWMIISPFALGAMTKAVLWNNILLGIVIALVAIGSASSRAPATV
jgi:SPW repeat-containing protein